MGPIPIRHLDLFGDGTESQVLPWITCLAWSLRLCRLPSFLFAYAHFWRRESSILAWDPCMQLGAIVACIAAWCSAMSKADIDVHVICRWSMGRWCYFLIYGLVPWYTYFLTIRFHSYRANIG